MYGTAMRKLMNYESGGLDNSQCPDGGGNKCSKWCGPVCKWCGFRKHTAIHGTIMGRTDDKPYGHKYEPEPK